MSICLIDKESSCSKQITINTEFLYTTMLKKTICAQLSCQPTELKLLHFGTDQEYKQNEIVKSGDTIHYLISSRNHDNNSLENKKKGIVDPDELEKIIQNSKVIVVKSSNQENIQKAKDHSLWATTFSNQERLKYFFHNSQNVILLFATNRSFQIKGIARMESEPDRMTDKSVWSGVSNIRLGGNFKIRWLRKKPLSLVLVEKALGTIFKDTIIKACDGQELDPFSCKKLASLFQTPLEPYYSTENKSTTSINKSSQKIKNQEFFISIPMILPPLPFSQNPIQQTLQTAKKCILKIISEKYDKDSSSSSSQSRKKKKIKKSHKKSKKHKKTHKKYLSSSDSSNSSEVSCTFILTQQDQSSDSKELRKKRKSKKDKKRKKSKKHCS